MFIIPMAGLSKRFTLAGYDQPKYMLDAHNKSLFEHAMLSFKKYFESESFLFICLDVKETKKFIESKCITLGIKNFDVIVLEEPTLGQAETVYLGLIKANVPGSTPITIFNIDTFRPGFEFATNFDWSKTDGYLETFIGEGDNWSNIVPKSKGDFTVELTAEKKQVSKYCCTGLYHWERAEDFIKIFINYRKKDIKDVDGSEYYIAPMYNDLISMGKTVNYSIVPRTEVIFCGVPQEYIEFLDNKI
ncbi:MAG: capsular biosynthesis protein [Paraglaciecola sp.]|uniref:capsular biosynthesis protein n=1 Tax=Paraglaciecola sp. TaxID=1920173 RepID=UPI003296A7B4